MSIESGRRKYDRNATETAWQNGIDNADSPGETLQDMGVSNLNTSAFDQDWRDGIEDGEDYEPDGEAWQANFSDASNWSYSGNR